MARAVTFRDCADGAPDPDGEDGHGWPGPGVLVWCRPTLGRPPATSRTIPVM
jgi:hypothetical protein